MLKSTNPTGIVKEFYDYQQFNIAAYNNADSYYHGCVTPIMK